MKMDKGERWGGLVDKWCAREINRFCSILRRFIKRYQSSFDFRTEEKCVDISVGVQGIGKRC
jgi:hypothetical protein